MKYKDRDPRLPWSVVETKYDCEIRDADGCWMATCGQWEAEFIVACVNTLAGVKKGEAMKDCGEPWDHDHGETSDKMYDRNGDTLIEIEEMTGINVCNFTGPQIARIKSCVNACSGLNPEALPRAIEMFELVLKLTQMDQQLRYSAENALARVKKERP